MSIPHYIEPSESSDWESDESESSAYTDFPHPPPPRRRTLTAPSKGSPVDVFNASDEEDELDSEYGEHREEAPQAAINEDPVATSSADLESPSPPKKARTQRRTPTKASPRRSRIKARGFGSKVADFPIDVLWEIMSYAEPMDMLNMSRVNKGIHDALTSKSSRFVWKKTIENVGLPECPEDLNEMQYIHFALDPYCNSCSTVGRKRQQFFHLYVSREKVCRKCLDSDFEEIYYYSNMHIPRIEVVKKYRGGREETEVFAAKAVIEAWRETDASFEDKEERKKWRNGLASEMKEREKLRPLLKAWLDRGNAAENKRKDAARQARLDAIVANMKEEGWVAGVVVLEKGEVASFDDLKKIRGVNNTAILSEQAWERLRPKIATLMEEVLEKQTTFEREEAEKLLISTRCEQSKKRVPIFKEAFTAYICARPYDPYGPRAVDFIHLPAVQDVLFDSLEADQVRTAFDQLLNDGFDDLVVEWRSSVGDRLLEIMREKMPEATEEDLWHPVTTFACSEYDCKRRLPTSSAMVHWRCDLPDKDIANPYNLPGPPWKGSWLSFDHETYIKAKAAFERLNIVPTTDPMVASLYQCPECTEREWRPVVMTWFEAFSSANSCTLANNHTLIPVSLIDEHTEHKNLYMGLKLAGADDCIACASCYAQLTTGGNRRYSSAYSNFERLIGHQRSSHGKEATVWVEGEDFYRTPDTVPVLLFGKDFVISDREDPQSFVIRMIRSLGGCSRLTDLRVSDEFAQERYYQCTPYELDIELDVDNSAEAD